MRQVNTDSHSLSLNCCAFLSSSDTTTFSEAVKDDKWCQAMNMELRALESNGTWSLTTLTPGKRAIGCKWLFKTKFNSDALLKGTKLGL